MGRREFVLKQSEGHIDQEMLDQFKMHVAIFRKLGGSEIPKHHLMLHMLIMIKWHGNPLAYSTWLDESLNKDLKKTLRNCHQHCFEPTAFAKMNDVLERRVKRQRLE